MIVFLLKRCILLVNKNTLRNARCGPLSKFLIYIWKSVAKFVHLTNLTPLSGTLPQKLIISQLIKTIAVKYVNRKFITLFIGMCHFIYPESDSSISCLPIMFLYCPL